MKLVFYMEPYETRTIFFMISQKVLHVLFLSIINLLIMIIDNDLKNDKKAMSFTLISHFFSNLKSIVKISEKHSSTIFSKKKLKSKRKLFLISRLLFLPVLKSWISFRSLTPYGLLSDGRGRWQYITIFSVKEQYSQKRISQELCSVISFDGKITIIFFAVLKQNDSLTL